MHFDNISINLIKCKIDLELYLLLEYYTCMSGYFGAISLLAFMQIVCIMKSFVEGFFFPSEVLDLL